MSRVPLRALGSRRLIAVMVVVPACLALALVLWPGRPQGPGSYRVDAIFDVARGIGPQQVVKVAGAQVGTVTAVRLTRDDRARVQMSVDPRFGPFRANASCQIVSEGLISENFVSCTPGSPPAAALARRGGMAPTVPVSRTSAPVSLQDLFNIWTTPVSERLTVLLDDLGIGVSARAGDIQAILDRANPGLAAARRAIAVVNRQRGQLQQIVTSAAPVVGQLASHDRSVQRFLDSTARLTTVTAEHRAGLAASLQRLPALLRAARPALAALDGVASTAPPLLDELRQAAPELARVTTLLPPFAGQAITALRRTSPALVSARTALSAATPTLGRLAGFARDADPAGQGLDRLLVSLRDSGAIESLLRGLYNGAALTSHYDADSHVIFADLLQNQCEVYATTPDPLCNAHTNGSVGAPGALATSARHSAAGSSPSRLRVPGLGSVPVAAGASAAASPAVLQRLLNFLH